jgi:preprotein translocase subunit SecF
MADPTPGSRRRSGESAPQVFWETKLAFDFMRWRQLTLILSTLLVVASLALLGVRGLNFGHFPEAADPQAVRLGLEAQGYGDLVVQNFGTARDVLVRVPPDVVGETATVGDVILEALRADYGDQVALRRSEFVGPAVGEELREQGGLAMLAALSLVMVYIMFRFTGKFALSAVIALVHDVIITLGAFSLFRWSFDLPSLAAVLAVIGYSLNDTIVVADRIRENFRALRRAEPIAVINQAISQSFGRTLVTSLTTLLVLIALLLFGGSMIEGFAEALVVGVLVGTYSSIYVAANALLLMGVEQKDLLVPEKEGQDQDALL